jgi:hypothetical protein
MKSRNKKRPEEVDFWDFDCRYGANEASCGVIHVSEINKVISEADAEGTIFAITIKFNISGCLSLIDC